MRIDDLSSFPAGSTIDADLLIIGGGPAGLAIARELIGTRLDVLVAESGQQAEDPRFAALNAVESAGGLSEAQRLRRAELHGAGWPAWSGEVQQYGARCRALGGSTHAWAGKSAAFDEIDFAARPWMPYSGWPFPRRTLDPYLDRAAGILNLGPNCYDDRLWELIGVRPPGPPLNADLLRSFFWQFARSRLDQLDIMRLGAEFAALDAPNIRVLTNATVTRLDTDAEGTAFRSAEVATIDGARSRIAARAAVLAAGGIENPRLLLVSNRAHPGGLGNRRGLVGRFLMDHPGARIGRFGVAECPPVARRFGFYGLKAGGRTHMYAHGLAASPALQARERLLNCAVYMLEDRAPDDPWDALKRLLRARSERPASDLLALARSPGLLAKGAAMRLFESGRAPEPVKRALVDALIRFNPNFVVREFQSRGLPHKLRGLMIDAITEQRPDPDSRITLSERRDRLGVPLPRAHWRVDDDARRSLIRLGKLIAAEFPRVGLPAPALEDWVAHERPDEAVIVDMAHSLGTTRMSEDPRTGVVDPECRVHGVSGLYVAGGSVFPTSGHANPTLMIVALAVRLAERIRVDFEQRAFDRPPVARAVLSPSRP